MGQEIGSISQEVHTNGGTVGSGEFRLYGDATSSKTVLASTESEISIGQTNTNMWLAYDSNSIYDGIKNHYAKKAVYTIYYPEGMEFDSISGFSAYTLDDVKDEPENSRVIVTINRWSSGSSYAVNYKVPEGTTLGEYSNPALDTLEVTYYDGKSDTLTLNPVRGIYSVEVIDESEVTNTISVVSRGNGYIDTNIENHEKSGPFFRVTNSMPGTRRNQIAHFEIGDGYQVTQVKLPFDSSIVGNEITEIEYKTNLNGWRTLSSDQLNALLEPTTTGFTGRAKILTKEIANLDEDEFFTEVKAKVGSFSPNYLSSTLSVLSSDNITVHGSLDSFTTEATVTFSMYDETDKSNTLSTSTAKMINSSSSDKTVVSNAKAEIKDVDGKVITQLKAGDKFNLSGSISIHSYPYGNTTVMQAPEIYLRQPSGMNIAIDTLSLSYDGVTVSDDWWYVDDTYTNDAGEIIYKIKTIDEILIGGPINDEYKSISFSYDVVSEPKANGKITTQDLIAFGREGYSALSSTGSATAPIVDIHDFNNNGDTDEYILTTALKSINILENANVLVETFLSIAGENSKPYVEGDASTLAYFTPGTEADYTVKITNNTTEVASNYTVYIPVPKTGQNFGTLFQPDDFSWDMKLESLIAAQSGFEIMYSIQATEENYDKAGANYVETPSDLKEVNMVRIEATHPLAAGAEVEFNVPLRVDEEMNDDTAENKIGQKNVYNPVYSVTSSTFVGTLYGTKVGAELVIAEIGGTVFIDKNADGLYRTEDGDTPLQGHEVKLYKLNASGDYEPVMKDSTHVSVMTDVDGKYVFNYEQQLGYDTYGVEFVAKADHEYTVRNNTNSLIDSDAIISGTDKGKVFGIDATIPSGMTIGCGFIEYDASSELDVDLISNSTSVKVGNTLIVGTTAKPTFWTSIKDTTTPYTWEIIGDATEKAKATLTNNDANGSVTITPTAITSGTTTFQIQVTIQDIYGNTKVSDPITITVIAITPPTIIAPDKTVYVGDTVNLLDDIIANDNEGNEITLVATPGIMQNTVITHDIDVEDNKYTTAGTYEVTYTISDVYGNSATEKRLVKVNSKPVINVDAQAYPIDMLGIDTIVEGIATASYMKADDTAGNVPTETFITPVTYEILNGPSTVFDTVGIYEVKYSAVHDGETITKTVDVAITPTDMVYDNEMGISAQNVALTQSEAQGLTEEQIIEKVNAIAFAFIADGGTLNEVNNVTTDITTTSLNAIKAVGEEGGDFTITLTVTGDSGIVSKEVTVVVEGTEVQIANGIVIKAKDFTVANADAAGLSEGISKTNGEVSSYVLSTKDAVTGITVDTTELAAIQAAGLTGGTYDLTFTATSGLDTVTIIVEVTVSSTTLAPTITASDIEVYVGDTVNLLDSVSAVDALGNNIILVAIPGATQNTVITHNIDIDDNKYTTAGTYEVTYVISDIYGNSAPVTRLIKINSEPVINADIQVYPIDIPNIDTEVESAANASYMKAGNTEGAGLTETFITPVTYEILDGPSTAFDTVGIYEVKYTAVHDSKTITKTVTVAITPTDMVIDNEVGISAGNIALTQSEAQGLTEEQILEKVNALAFEFVTVDGNLTEVNNVTTDVTTSSLDAIKNVGEEGGEFTITVTVTGNNGSVSKEVTVVVEGTEVQVANGIVLKAKDFTVANLDASGLTEAISKTNGEVSAYVLATKDAITGITVDTTELGVIQAAGLTGGIYDLTFTATSGLDIVTITVEVTVSSTSVPPTITTSDVDVFVGDTVDLLDGISAVDAVGNTITLKTSGDDKNTTITHSIPVEDDTFITAGTYEVTYVITDAYGNSATESRIVKVFGLPVLDAKPQTYEITTSNIIEQIEENVNASYGFANDTIGVAEERELSVTWSIVDGPTTDFSQIGMYSIKYEATTPEGKYIEKTVEIAIVHKGLIVDETNSIAISGVGFSLDLSSAGSLSATQAKDATKGNVVAYRINKDEDGNVVSYTDLSNQISVNDRQITDIKGATTTGNIYDLLFEVVDNGQSVRKKVKVVVLGTRTPAPVDTTDYDALAITASDFTLTYDEAKALTNDQAIENSEVIATLINGNENTNRRSTVGKDIAVSTSGINAVNNIGENGGVTTISITSKYIDENNAEIVNVTDVEVTVLEKGETKPTVTGNEGNSSSTVGTNDITNITIYLVTILLSITGLLYRKKKQDQY
ncbi:MAG: beta strand repeat-containing protein [Coprobacillaceae bacterium]